MNVPNSIEMGVFPFVAEADLVHAEEILETSSGPVNVDIYGERGKHPIVTFHEIGMNAANNFENFFQYQTCSKLTEHFCVYNINAPGQEVGAKKLPANYHYPTMDGLAQIVHEIVSQLPIKSFIGIGIGAGANILLRYALNHSNSIDALILINATSQKAGWVEWFYQKWNLSFLRADRMTQFTVDYLMWHHFGKHLDEYNPDILQQYRNYFFGHPNPWNLGLFIESFLNRTEIALRDPKTMADFLLDVPVLQIVGINSAFLNGSVHVNSQLNPRISEWLKISDSCGLVLDDKPLEVTHALLLFLQGLGFCTNINVPKLMRTMKDEKQGKGRTGQAFSSAIEQMDEI